ncbi:hypothetical protein [Thermococcus prieurii]
MPQSESGSHGNDVHNSTHVFVEYVSGFVNLKPLPLHYNRNKESGEFADPNHDHPADSGKRDNDLHSTCIVLQCPREPVSDFERHKHSK